MQRFYILYDFLPPFLKRSCYFFLNSQGGDSYSAQFHPRHHDLQMAKLNSQKYIYS